MNNINASIIDQRVRQLARDLAPEIKTRLDSEGDETRLRSIAFVYRQYLEGKSAFPGNGITEVIQTVKYLFDPNAAVSSNDQLAERVEEICCLGLTGNRVNQAISDTLNRLDEQGNSYFHNNGITLICSKFSHNALQGENYQVKVQGLQVTNGGQTCKTIQMTLAGQLPFSTTASLLVRLCELPGEEQDLIRNITYATNSQNPVDLRDLRSNDERQRRLDVSISSLGYQYRRQRGEPAAKPTDITSATAAEAVLSVWRKRPNQAAFSVERTFRKTVRCDLHQ